MRISFVILPLSCVALVVAAVLAFASGSIASSNNSAALPAGETMLTGHLVLAASDFMSMTPGCPIVNGGKAVIHDSSVCHEWLAPVHFPDGSTVTNIKVTYLDTEEFANLFVALHQTSLDGVSGFDLPISGQLPDPGNSDFNFASLGGEEPIDNVFQHYDVRFSLENTPGLAFSSAVISYQYPAPATGSGINGDADCSGTVNQDDTLALLKHEAGFTDPQNCPIG